MEYVKRFEKINKHAAGIAGGKGASLGEMTQAGISVPPGYVVLASAFEHFLTETDLNVEIDSILHTVNHEEMHTVEKASVQIQNLILSAKMPVDIASEIDSNFATLDVKYVAVRSSATAEDSASAAWAGQLDSYLNTTQTTLLQNVQRCWASLFTPRAIFYRFEKGLHAQHISVAVVVQAMVNSEKSGIAFSVHPVTEDYNQLIIEAGFGLGEAIVSGQVTPDSYVVEKEPRRIIDINVSQQSKALYRQDGGGNEWKDLSEADGSKQVLTEEQILELSELILKIENHYGFPCDIEWAFESGNFYITQSRPITTLTKIKQDEYLKNEEDHYSKSDARFIEPNFYRQEGEVGLYQIQVPALMLTRKNMLSVSAGNIWIYFKNGYLRGLWDKNRMKQVVEEFLIVAKNGFPEEWLDKWKEIKNEVFEISKKISQIDLDKCSRGDLYSLYEEMLTADKKMWGLSIFIDCFDPGYDTDAIAAIKYKYNFTDDEVSKLLQPNQASYVTELERKLHEVRQGNISQENFRTYFFWARTNYTNFCEIDEKWLNDQIVDIHTYSNPEIDQDTILKKYDLIKNPFEIFQTLSVWRDERKRLNYIGLYGRMRLLREGMRRINVDPICANYLELDEVEPLFGGVLNIDKLFARNRDGVLVLFKEDNNRECYFGKEAADKFSELESSLDKPNSDQIKGVVACNGKACGKVKIIRVADSKEAQLFETGDILVTSMTRPEFTPLMKKAAAIITDEGGISSHASIVSRELNKPCIIGTGNATEILKDGDMVEVDADNGVVKIVK